MAKPEDYQAGNDVPKENRRWWHPSRTAFGFAVTAAGFIAATTGSLYSSAIIASAPLCCDDGFAPIYGRGVRYFWIFAGLWGTLLFFREIAKGRALQESQRFVDRIERSAGEIKAAVDTFPPERFVDEYAAYSTESHRFVSSVLQRTIDPAIESSAARALEQGIHRQLTMLAALARTYDDRPAVYGANVMLFIRRADTEPWFPSRSEAAIRRYLIHGFDFKKLAGVLVLLDKLAVEDVQVAIRGERTLTQIETGTQELDGIDGTEGNSSPPEGSGHAQRGSIEAAPAEIARIQGGVLASPPVKSDNSTAVGQEAQSDAPLAQPADVADDAKPESDVGKIVDEVRAADEHVCRRLGDLLDSSASEHRLVIFPVPDYEHLRDPSGRWRVLPGSATVWAKWHYELMKKSSVEQKGSNNHPGDEGGPDRDTADGGRSLAEGVRWIHDLRALSNELGDLPESYCLDEQVISQLHHDYSEVQREGQQVRSFISFPLLGADGDAIGTLNIHCNLAGFLGTADASRIRNFGALVIPLVNDVGALVEAWSNLTTT